MYEYKLYKILSEGWRVLIIFIGDAADLGCPSQQPGGWPRGMLGQVAVGNVTLLSWDFLGDIWMHKETRHSVVDHSRGQETC